MLDQDDSMMSLSDRMSYIQEIRETFGDEAAQSLADELGVFFPGLIGADPESAALPPGNPLAS